LKLQDKAEAQAGSALAAPMEQAQEALQASESVRLGSTYEPVPADFLKSRLQARHPNELAAARQQAENDLKRATDLIQQKILSQSEFDNAQSKFRMAAAAEAEAKTLLGYTEIVAPFAGVITRKLADVGDLAAPGKPLIEIEDPSALQMEADVPDGIAANIQQGSRLAIRVGSADAELTGVVREIAPVADPNSRTFHVKLDLPPTAGLMPGQFARLAVPVGDSRTIRVPAAAVIQRGQMELVFVVVNGKAQLRIVRIGKRVADECEVVSGLNSGDQIVTEGAATLTDGQPVSIQK
jgi:RND family efflux transporter MFP subunit